MSRKSLQHASSPARPAYRRVVLPVPEEPQNGIEELGTVLLLGAALCFAAGAIVRAL